MYIYFLNVSEAVKIKKKKKKDHIQNDLTRKTYMWKKGFLVIVS